MGLAQRKRKGNFDELSEEAKEHAIKEHARFLQEEWSGEQELIHFKEELEKNGYQDAEIHFTGFYSQGDGACFDAKINDEFFIKKYAKHLGFSRKRVNFLIKLKNEDVFWFDIKETPSSYYHEKTRYVYWNGNYSYEEFIDEQCGDNEFKRVCFIAVNGDGKKFEDDIEKLRDIIEEDRLEWCEKIFNALKDDYEFIGEDENAIDSIRMNEYDFDEDGNI